ncbi:MAG: ECF transporter S component [Clostridia bacterium]|nr:ECF transporter S component [Clostridia bacterium]
MSSKKTLDQKTLFRLTLTALFIAVIIVMDFTPIGYITTGLFSITLLTIPVALGAACTGVIGGAILGLVFGLTSFLQAFAIGYFIDPSAAVLFSENPAGYAITCFVPRIIAGLVSALVFRIFEQRNKIGIPAFAVSACLVPIMNTFLFMTSFALFYRNTQLGGASVMAVIISALTLNFLIELSVTVIAGVVINKTIYRYAKRFS